MRFRILLSIFVLLAVSACTQSTQSAKPAAASGTESSPSQHMGDDKSASAPESTTSSMAATSTSKPKKFFGVSLEPKENPLSVKVKSPPQGAKASRKNKPGFIGFDEGDSGWIFFGIKKEDLGNKCPDETDSDLEVQGTASWVISRISVSAYGDEAEEKGTHFDSVQPAWIKEAFPAAQVDNNGHVYGHLYKESSNAPGQTFMGIYNANEQEGFRYVFYEVELRNCANNLLAITDPMVGNGGRGSH